LAWRGIVWPLFYTPRIVWPETVYPPGYNLAQAALTPGIFWTGVYFGLLHREKRSRDLKTKVKTKLAELALVKFGGGTKRCP